MDKSGIQQWNITNYLEVYPISYYADRQRLGELYVLRKEDVVIGAVVLLQSDECWPQMADSPAYYVHNLVNVGPKWQIRQRTMCTILLLSYQ